MEYLDFEITIEKNPVIDWMKFFEFQFQLDFNGNFLYGYISVKILSYNTKFSNDDGNIIFTKTL